MQSHRPARTAALPSGTDVIAETLHMSLLENWTSFSRCPDWQSSDEPGYQETSLPLVPACTFVTALVWVQWMGDAPWRWDVWTASPSWCRSRSLATPSWRC